MKLCSSILAVPANLTLVCSSSANGAVTVAQSLSAGVFDVSGLNIYRVGGDSGPMASIFSGDTGGFRIDGITFETFVVPEPSAALLGGLGLLGLLRRRRA